MIISKLTSKAQTTIPQPIREVLGVAEGDSLVYAIEADRVILTKAPTRPRLVQGATDIFDPFASWLEWEAEDDRQAYAALKPARLRGQ